MYPRKNIINGGIDKTVCVAVVSVTSDQNHIVFTGGIFGQIDVTEEPFPLYNWQIPDLFPHHHFLLITLFTMVSKLALSAVESIKVIKTLTAELEVTLWPIQTVVTVLDTKHPH